MMHQTSVEAGQLPHLSKNALLVADELPISLYRLLGNGHLREFHTSFYISVALSQSILQVLRSPHCRVEKLCICVLSICSQEELLQTSFGWAELLRDNSTLKTLNVKLDLGPHPQDLHNSLTEVWQPLLCSSNDTIESTYTSNHVLECIEVEFSVRNEQDKERNQTPIEIYSLLKLNRNPNKAAVASSKVLKIQFSGTEVHRDCLI
jgi:hypothetical protein